jgi:hypothetical protein
MTGEDDDKALREAFGQSRRADAAEIPAFARVWGAARARSLRRVRPVFRFALAGLGALALAAVLLWRPPAPSLEPPRAPSVIDWRSPTDFLLRTPGREVLGAPALGGLPDYSRIPGLEGITGSNERRRSS